MADRLLASLIRAGAKASKIAQLCRAEKSLFSILVQEKGKRQNSSLDFKTLADVFIQQVAQSEISSQCPEISNRVYGEENNQFTNTLGETITVEMKKTKEETTSLLTKVLDGNSKAAKLFAETAHHFNEPLDIDAVKLSKLAKCNINLNDVGVWIDPIDATSQYVNGFDDIQPIHSGVYPMGLQCVTVLIGAYNMSTGLPIIGVVFQPFHEKTSESWQTKCYWGVCHDKLRINNVDEIFEKNMKLRSGEDDPLVVVSSSEVKLLHALNQRRDVKVCSAGGAGYKCLCAVQGLVDAYFYSGDSCFAWDTCAAHALLLSMGGGIIRFKDLNKDFSGDPSKLSQLTYNNPNSNDKPAWAHVGGIVAYSNSEKSKNCLYAASHSQSLL